MRRGRQRLLVGGWLGGPGTSVWLMAGCLILAFCLGIGSILVVDASQFFIDRGSLLTGDITAVIEGRDLESADAAAARGAEVLTRTPGVSRVTILEPEEGDRAIARLIGVPAEQDARMVSILATERVRAPCVVAVLERAGITSIADDHRGYRGALERRLLVAEMVAGLIVLATLTSLFLLGQISARGQLLFDVQRIDLMVRLGADPRIVAGVWAGRTALAAVLGTLTGVLAALICLAMLIITPSNSVGGLDTWGLYPLAIVDGLGAAIWLPILPPAAALGAWIATYQFLKRAGGLI